MQEIISTSANVVTAIAAAVGVWIAYRGVATWRQQLIGQGQYAVAKRLLTRLLELEIIVKRIREPLSLGFVDLWDKLNRKQMNLAFVFCEARAVWGSDLPKTEAKLAQLLTKLFRSRHWQEEADKDNVPEDTREKILQERVEGIRYCVEPESDEFGKSLRAAIEEMEMFLRPVLSH